jgi:hypothetical protein
MLLNLVSSEMSLLYDKQVVLDILSNALDINNKYMSSLNICD